MTAKEQQFLTEQLSHSNFYLEYGSGNSTRLAVENDNIRDITSMESDCQFWQTLIESDRRLLKAVEEKRLTPLLVNIGKTAMWGYPADDSRRKTLVNICTGAVCVSNELRFDSD